MWKGWIAALFRYQIFGFFNLLRQVGSYTFAKRLQRILDCCFLRREAYNKAPPVWHLRGWMMWMMLDDWVNHIIRPGRPWMPVELVKVENWPPKHEISTGWDGGPQLMSFCCGIHEVGSRSIHPWPGGRGLRSPPNRKPWAEHEAPCMKSLQKISALFQTPY